MAINLSQETQMGHEMILTFALTKLQLNVVMNCRIQYSALETHKSLSLSPFPGSHTHTHTLSQWHILFSL